MRSRSGPDRRVRGPAGGLLLVVVPLVVLLSACDGGRTDAAGAGDDLPDCRDAQCAAEVAAYGRAVASLPGVADVRELSYQPAQITDSASVSGAIEVAAGTACASLEDDLGRLLWQSALPVAYVQLECFQPGATGSDYEYAGYSFGLKDTDELAARWGPRGG